ncbi:MAG: trypsin-like peptidase domain-containing protein [Thermoleophilia bacterium]|nr:trypsin-like peptidase domain-containing protein [Thermoleophilia bacterium]
MRPTFVAVLALAAALVGGATVFLLSEVGGDDGEPARAVVIDDVDGAPATPAVRIRPGEFDPAGIYAARSPGVVTIYAVYAHDGVRRAAQGSGFVVSPQGHILTSAHVITSAGSGAAFRGADRVYVGFADGDRIPARVVGWDLYDDVGVVRVEPSAHKLQPLPLGDSDSVRVGEPVAAIGSPFRHEGSLAVGIVSATARSIPTLTSRYQIVDAIQTDAPITHGNSGGPLLDARGRVVGINAQIRTESGQPEGVGFAIPINAGKRSLRQLIATGRVRYPYVGIGTDDLIPSLARHLDLPVRRGALVADVRDGSPADRAGLRGGTQEEIFNGVTYPRGGDIVVAIGGHPIMRSDDVARVLLERYRPGQTVEFTVIRDGRREAVPVTLGVRQSAPDDAP